MIGGMSSFEIRDLTTIDDFRRVVELEREIWGYTDNADMVGVPVFIFTVHRGATLIGAVDPSGRMVGFAYAVVGMKAGRPMLWSHMTGVLPDTAAVSATASSSNSAIAPWRRVTT